MSAHGAVDSDDDDGDSGRWGLLGLGGLADLAGLLKRPAQAVVEDDTRTRGTTGTNRLRPTYSSIADRVVR